MIRDTYGKPPPERARRDELRDDSRDRVRTANAKNEATYLLARVEVVAIWKRTGINRARLESLCHRLFAPAHLDNHHRCLLRPPRAA